jgi:hypothetical protein
VRHIEHHLLRQDLRVLEHLLDRVDRAAGDAGCIQGFHPVCGGIGCELASDQGVDAGTIGNPDVLRRVQWIGLELGHPQRVHQPAEKCIVGRGNGDFGIAGGEQPIGRGDRMVVAAARGDGAAREVVGGDVGQHADHAVGQGHFCRLPLPGCAGVKDRGRDGQRRIQPGDQVAER